MTQWNASGIGVAAGYALLSVALLLGGCRSGPGEGSRVLAAVSAMESPAGPGSLAPRLSTGPGEAVVLSWLEPAEADSYALYFSRLRQDGAWGAPERVSAGTDWFINWADFPSVVPVSGETWAAHWLVKRSGGPYAYDIALALSGDAGSSWMPALTPHDDGTPTEHGFVSLFPWSDGIGAVWLDGRNTTPPEQGQDDGGAHPTGAMSLRYARLLPDGAVVAGGEIDGHVCDCCPTSVAISSDGPVVAYRGRTQDEIRDIHVTRYMNGSWTPTITVGADDWRIPGCPVNGPAIAAADQRVAVAWYAAPNREAHVSVAFSTDAGASFLSPVRLDEGSVSGRVDIALDEDGVLVSWLARNAEGTGQLRARHVAFAGDAGPLRVIAEGDISRASGFPQMVRIADELLFAWTDPGEPSRLVTVRVPTAAIR